MSQILKKKAGQEGLRRNKKISIILNDAKYDTYEC